MACNYIYKGKTYSREEFYKFVEENLVEKKQVPAFQKIRWARGGTAAYLS